MSLSGVALGCGNFGGIGSVPEFFGRGITHEEAMAIMDRAWANDIRWFDTGDAYGGGASESWIGEWGRLNGRDDLQVTTKVFHSTDGTAGDTGLAPERIRRQLASSLERLGVERVDLYLAHEPDSATPISETIATFEALRAEGLIGAWGLSNYDADGLEEALVHGRPALLQNAYSLLARGDEERVLPLCVELGISYVPYGPLSGGWLTGKYRRGEPFPAGSRMTMRPGPYERYLDASVFDGLDLLREEAEARGVDMATLAFAWVLSNPDIAGGVCGPNHTAQLDPVLAGRELELTTDDRDRIGRFFRV
jgi:aryl-alcohol dehydrogenase-like predicted oxidoreductase